jgi:acyl-CoA synthetase (AMP-forming)/AMP-acid ligase II
MPLYHIGARNTCLTRNVHGCTIVLHRSFRPEAFFESLRRHAVTETLLAPTMLNDLLQHFPDPRQALPSLQRVFYSAAPMPEAILRRGIAALGSIFAQVYGMTESGGPGCILHQHQHVLEGEEKIVRRLRSAGQPMFGCDVRVVDAAGRECAVGELGEIVIRDGFVFIMDRLKDMIVSGGENIYSREIEDAIISHPAIAEAAVVGAPDERWGERVVAFVVKKPGQDASAEAIIEHCRQKIASYKRPKQVFFLDCLPKLPNGKIEKFKLRDPLWANRSRAI